VSFAPAWPLETERLVLRPFEAGDLDALRDIHGDAANALYLQRAADAGAGRGAAPAEDRRAAIRAEGDWLSAAAVLRDTGEVVWDVVLHWASEAHGQGEIGFIAHPAHHGRGYTTEAAQPLLAFAFETLGLHRVVGRLEPRNAASARVLDKLGMRREAHFVENEWVKGEWQSELVYAMLAREWTSRPSSSNT
jgi:RimJ/RimL family protein N-acetyltransferase